MARKKKTDIEEAVVETVKEIGKEFKEKLEEAGKEIKEKAEKISEGIKEEVKEGWENVDFGIDVFSGQHDNKEEKKHDGKKEEKEEKSLYEEQSEKIIENKEEEKETKGRKKISKELKEKAKKLAEKFGGENIKEKLEKVREKEKEKGKNLIPLEDYVKYGCYIGAKVITPNMRPFVYKRRNDGIAIIDTNIIDKKLKEAIELINKYNPEDWILVCKREAGWKAIEKFSQLTGVRIFTKKYPAGILTNIRLPKFFETEMVFICDPWLDKNAMNDSKIMKKKVFSLCDTNNYPQNVDVLIPCNNKSGKSIGLILYIIAREYLKERGINTEVRLENFIPEEEKRE
mgnify:CR=1 FL=1